MDTRLIIHTVYNIEHSTPQCNTVLVYTVEVWTSCLSFTAETLNILLLLVSSLFPDVVNCMQTDNLELKKLVYLYLMNYAKSQPDMAIMAVNSFVKV